MGLITGLKDKASEYASKLSRDAETSDEDLHSGQNILEDGNEDSLQQVSSALEGNDDDTTNDQAGSNAYTKARGAKYLSFGVFSSMVAGAKDKQEFWQMVSDKNNPDELEIPGTGRSIDTGLPVRDTMEDLNSYWDNHLSRVVREWEDIEHFKTLKQETDFRDSPVESAQEVAEHLPLGMRDLTEATADKVPGHFFCASFMAEQAGKKFTEGYEPKKMAAIGAGTLLTYNLVKEGWIEGGMYTGKTVADQVSMTGQMPMADQIPAPNINFDFSRTDLRADWITNTLASGYGFHKGSKEVADSENADSYHDKLSSIQSSAWDAVSPVSLGDVAYRAGRGFGRAERGLRDIVDGVLEPDNQGNGYKAATDGGERMDAGSNNAQKAELDASVDVSDVQLDQRVYAEPQQREDASSSSNTAGKSETTETNTQMAEKIVEMEYALDKPFKALECDSWSDGSGASKAEMVLADYMEQGSESIEDVARKAYESSRDADITSTWEDHWGNLMAYDSNEDSQFKLMDSSHYGELDDLDRTASDLIEDAKDVYDDGEYQRALSAAVGQMEDEEIREWATNKYEV